MMMMMMMITKSFAAFDDTVGPQVSRMYNALPFRNHNSSLFVGVALFFVVVVVGGTP
jgi:hypothetical protein